MKRIMLLAAVHALIINQAQKNAKSKKIATPKTVSQQGDFSKMAERDIRDNRNYLLSGSFYDISRISRSWSPRN